MSNILIACAELSASINFISSMHMFDVAQGNHV